MIDMCVRKHHAINVSRVRGQGAVLLVGLATSSLKEAAVQRNRATLSVDQVTRSRYFARGFITRKLSGNEKFRLIDSAIAREGWRIVLLMRFVPIPFGLANYCYGISPVPFVPYFLATIVAITPPNLLFVWMGSTFQGELSAMLGKGRAHNPIEYVFLALGILAALLALRFAAKVARAAVAKSAGEPANVE